jgi:hypothetical protein
MAGGATGLVSAMALAIFAPLLGMVIDAGVNQGRELAGLGGLVLGALVGAALLLIATIAAFIVAARRRSTDLRGAAWGLLTAIALIGLIGLIGGICASAM